METKDKIINPHDKFFKEFFSKEQEAREFLSLYLPEDIKKYRTLNSLHLQGLIHWKRVAGAPLIKSTNKRSKRYLQKQYHKEVIQ